MPAKLRVVLLTGDERRHRYAASAIARALDLVGVTTEPKFSPLTSTDQLLAADQDILRRHLQEREAVECRLLGDRVEFPNVELLRLGERGINAPEVADWLARHDPDYVVLFGSGIVGKPLLERFAGRIVNVHLGLSPYYRGSATNFWPLVHGEPECVGATIHLAIAALDAGAILAQVRPLAEPGDRAHELGVKAIIEVFRVLPQALRRYAAGELTPQEQTRGKGRLCRRADFNADAVRKMWNNIEAGMIVDYASSGEQRRAACPILELSA